jgi:predicted DNA-binding transcriptional regulator AlpA
MPEDNEGRFLRPKQVARLLGVSVDTVRRIAKRDPDFPRFAPLAPRIHVVRESAVRRWLALRQHAAYTKAP